MSAIDSNQNLSTLTFGVFADPQYCDCEPDTELNRYFRKTAVKLEKCISHLNQNQQLNFVIGLGDLIDDGFKSFETVNQILGQSNKKLFHVAGNHDFEVKKENLDKVYAQLGLENDKYYSFIKSGWQFIFLDGNEITFNSNELNVVAQAEQITRKLKAENQPNFGEYNGGISQTQLHWLENQLQTAKEKRLKTVIICHYPLLPLTKYSLWNSDEIWSVISKYKNVKFWLNGHHHDGNYTLQNDVHFLTMKAMVDTENETAFAEISLSDNKIEIKGFGREISRSLEIK